MRVAAPVLGLYEEIVAWVNPRVAATRDLTAPTPCLEWNVSALLSHMLAGVRFFELMGRDGRVDPSQLGPPPDFQAQSPSDYFRSATDANIAAWSAPGRLEQTCQMPFGPMPGRTALGIHAADLLIHGWDLAAATQQMTTIDARLASFALDVEHALITEEMRGPDRAFGREVAVGEAASSQERLLAFVGRSQPETPTL